jgi:hypothetical protein
MNRKNLLLLATMSVASISAGDRLWAVDVAVPATQPSAADAEALVKQLGDDDFHVRQSAAAKLREMGKAAIPALQEAKKSSDPEIHNRADEILQDIDRPPSEAVPKGNGAVNGANSLRISMINGAKTVDATEPGRTVHIEEDGNGIAMKVTGQIDGKEVTREYKAKNADDLKKQNADAFALYQQYGNSGGIQLQGGGIILQNNIRLNINGGNGAGAVIVRPNRNVAPGGNANGGGNAAGGNAAGGNGAGGVGVQIIPGGNGAPGAIQVVPNPHNPSGDNLDKLEAHILEQMKSGNIPDDKQQEVKALLGKMKESLAQPAAANNDDARMREYNQQCDSLRKMLADLKLPDPGDALPPPASGRLGISASEEAVAGQGLTVVHVLPDSRAQKMGLKEQDVIQKVNGQEIHSTKDLRKAVTENPKGLVVEGLRDGKPVKLEEPGEK